MKPKRKRLNPDTVVLLKHIGIGVLVLAMVTLLIYGVWWGTRLPSLTITEVEARGGETIQHRLVEKEVQAQLEGAHLGLIPRAFAWFYPQEDILASLEQIERIHNIRISREGGTKLKIMFDEYVPRALWCDPSDSENCVFLDSTGYAFARAPKLSGGTFLRFVKSGESPILHESVVEEFVFNEVFVLTALLSERGWFISSVEIDQADDAFLKVVGGGELKVAFSQSPEETVENLFVVLGSEEFKHIKPGNFLYIDLRYGNKVFVNEELAAPEEETASEVKNPSEPEGELVE